MEETQIEKKENWKPLKNYDNYFVSDLGFDIIINN